MLVRGFQKAENLPVSGHLDTQMAAKLGVHQRVDSSLAESRKINLRQQ
jgi:hypothetical protein